MKKSADFLKECRESRNLSQKEVATQLGYSTSQFISNWERGQSQPPISKIRELAAIYKIDVQLIFDLILEDHVEEVKKSFTNRFYRMKDIETF